jgi:hypothetical protein
MKNLKKIIDLIAIRKRAKNILAVLSFNPKTGRLKIIKKENSILNDKKTEVGDESDPIEVKGPTMSIGTEFELTITKAQ